MKKLLIFITLLFLIPVSCHKPGYIDGINIVGKWYASNMKNYYLEIGADGYVKAYLLHFRCNGKEMVAGELDLDPPIIQYDNGVLTLSTHGYNSKKYAPVPVGDVTYEPYWVDWTSIVGYDDFYFDMESGAAHWSGMVSGYVEKVSSNCFQLGRVLYQRIDKIVID
jgi:hypothetical protein